jgi:hypothetical protein
MARKEKEEKGREAGKKAPTGREPGGHFEDLTFPTWFPAVLYGAVTLLLFRKFVFSGQMLYGQDTLSLGFAAREFFAQALKGGVFPFWNPLILGGTPFLESLAGGDSLYPTSLLLMIMEPFRALGWKLILHVFGAGLFTYGWVRALGRSRSAALLSGLAYLLAPFMVTLVYPGHDGKLFVTALTPLLFWATERGLASGRLRALGGMSLVIGLVILTTHFQQAYFLFGAVGIYAGARVLILWKSGLSGRSSASRFGLFLAFSLLGAGVSAIQLLPAVGYVTEFSRRTVTTTQASEAGGVAYSSSWSLHPEEVASLVVPEFVGNSAGGAEWTTGTYWGRNVFKLNHEYGGFVVLLLASLAFFGAPSRGIRLTFLGIGLVALLFALGAHTPVWRGFYELVPGISLFRAPSIATFLFGFGAVTLMAFGVDRVLGLGEGSGEVGKAPGATSQESAAKEDKGILWFLMGTTGVGLVAAALASSGALTNIWVSVLYAEMSPNKAEALSRAQDFITRGLFITTVLSGATLALVWAAQKKRVPGLVWVLGIGVLITADLARVDDPFIQTMDFADWAGPEPNTRYLMEQQESSDPFRVLAMGGDPGVAGSGQDVKPTIHGVELAAGHHPNDLARYRELIGMVGSGVPANFFTPDGTALNPTILSILNVRYVLWPVYRYGSLPIGEPVMASGMSADQVYEALYEIPTLPRARLVGDAVVLTDEEAVPYILSDQFRPGEEVVLSEAPDAELPGGPVTGEVEWVERTPNRMRLQVRAEKPALLVFAENWYPAWKARVGGTEASVLRANHSLRAVAVPAGQSEVEMYFDGGTLRVPLLISLVSLVLALLAIFGRRRKRTEPDDGNEG